MSAEVQVMAAQFRCKQCLDTVFVDGLSHNMRPGPRTIQSGGMTRVTMVKKSSKMMMVTWVNKKKRKVDNWECQECQRGKLSWIVIVPAGHDSMQNLTTRPKKDKPTVKICFGEVRKQWLERCMNLLCLRRAIECMCLKQNTLLLQLISIISTFVCRVFEQSPKQSEGRRCKSTFGKCCDYLGWPHCSCTIPSYIPQGPWATLG